MIRKHVARGSLPLSDVMFDFWTQLGSMAGRRGRGQSQKIRYQSITSLKPYCTNTALKLKHITKRSNNTAITLLFG